MIANGCFWAAIDCENGLGYAGMKGRAVFRSVSQDRLHEVGTGCRNLAKDAMRHCWKIANRTFIACAGKILGKVPGKTFGEIVLGKIW